ncbi:MAG: hypothetical protein AAB037_03730 [Chloroflexota bacterium]
MTEIDAVSRVFDAVAKSISETAARELWSALKSELVRQDGGPNAMKEFLDSEASRIKQIVEQAITKVASA